MLVTTCGTTKVVVEVDHASASIVKTLVDVVYWIIVLVCTAVAYAICVVVAVWMDVTVIVDVDVDVVTVKVHL